MACLALTGLTVTPLRHDSEWMNVELWCDGHLASAELQKDVNDYWVWSVKVVDENQRGRGYGTALMHNLVAHADYAGWTTLALMCQPALVRFYERFGFVVTMTNGIIVTMVRLRKEGGGL